MSTRSDKHPGPAAGVPASTAPIPARVAELAAGDTVTPVWRNELGGLTFRVTGETGERYIKWQSQAGLSTRQRREADLLAEAARLKWAAEFVPVPKVLDDGSCAGELGRELWLVTEAIPASSAYAPRWRHDPETAVRAMAEGLRHLHEALPVADCPFPFSWPGAADDSAPDPERLVVCHGDPCVPNTLLDEFGQFSAHVDLGALGVGDRWADLAVATLSISWDINFGRSYDELFFQTYGVEPDDKRISYYRRRWENGTSARPGDPR